MEKAHLYAVWESQWDGNAGKCWVGNGAAVGGQRRKWVGNLVVEEALKTGCNLEGLLQRGRKRMRRGFRRSRTTEMVAPLSRVAPLLLFLPSGVWAAQNRTNGGQLRSLDASMCRTQLRFFNCEEAMAGVWWPALFSLFCCSLKISDIAFCYFDSLFWFFFSNRPRIRGMRRPHFKNNLQKPPHL